MGRRRSGRLTTALFTDIVSSTEIAAELGDRRWKILVEAHHRIVRRALRRHGGREMDTAGDGFFAVFGSQAAAIRCACELVDQVRELGIEIRAGLDTGEAERIGGKVGGLAVTSAARIMATARAGEVVVSSVLHDLVPGSGFTFEDAGSHQLKGIDGARRLWRVRSVDGRQLEPPIEVAEARERRSRVEAGAPRRRLAVVALVATAIAATAVIAIAADGGDPPGRPVDGTTDGTTNAVTLAPGVAARIDPRTGAVTQQTDLVGTPYSVVWSSDRLWVLDEDGRIEMVVPGSSTPDVERFPETTCSIGPASDGGVWIADCELGVLHRVDTGLEIVETIALPPMPGDPAVFDAGADLWILVTNPRGAGDAILRLDRASGDVLRTIDLPGSELDAFDIAVTPLAVWTYNLDSGAIIRIDARTYEMKVIETRSAPNQIVSADGSIWIADGGPGQTIRYDRSTGQTIDVLDVYGTLVAGEDELFVVDGDTIERVNVEQNTHSPIFTIEIEPASAGPHPVTVGDGSLWIAVR